MKIKKIIGEWYIYILMIIIWIIASMITPYFRQISVFMTIVVFSVPLALIALGQNLVILCGKFDLSVGSILGLSTVIASVTMNDNIFLGIFIPLLVGTIVGLINGIAVSKFRIDSFIMTFGMMAVCQGSGLLIRDYPGGIIPMKFINFLLKETANIAWTPIIILIIALLVGEFILKRTNFGRNIYAVGNDEVIAYRSGINVTFIKTAVFAISGFMAALAGLFLSAVMASGDANVGVLYPLDSITAVVMGGTILSGGRGDYKGTIGAVLILTSLSRIFNLIGVNIWYTYIAKGLLLVIIVAIRMFGVNEQREAEL
jgi:ribose transport system permease protein